MCSFHPVSFNDLLATDRKRLSDILKEEVVLQEHFSHRIFRYNGREQTFPRNCFWKTDYVHIYWKLQMWSAYSEFWLVQERPIIVKLVSIYTTVNQSSCVHYGTFRNSQKIFHWFYLFVCIPIYIQSCQVNPVGFW